jgi:hypothetical protein
MVGVFALFFGGRQLWPNKRRRMLTGYALYFFALSMPPLVSHLVTWQRMWNLCWNSNGQSFTDKLGPSHPVESVAGWQSAHEASLPLWPTWQSVDPYLGVI